MYEFKNKKLRIGERRSAGFTLIEMLVAISVFTVLLGASIGAILSMVDANRKAQSLTSVINNLNIAIDTISRDVVVGRGYNVGPSSGETSCLVGDLLKTQINFQKTSDTGVAYRLNTSTSGGACDGFIEKNEYSHPGSPSSDDNDWRRITAPEVRIDNLVFERIGVGNDQPRVLILVEGQAGVQDHIVSDFRLQTTISQRSPEPPSES